MQAGVHRVLSFYAKRIHLTFLWLNITWPMKSETNNACAQLPVQNMYRIRSTT